MSSILFDPATPSGNPAGTRTSSKSAANAAAGLSFDSFLAKNQSRYEASTALRSDRTENDRGYDSDRDYKTSRTDDRDDKTDSAGRTESVDDDYGRRDEEEDLPVDASESEAKYSEIEEDNAEPSAVESNSVAVQSDEISEPAAVEETAAAGVGAAAASAAGTASAAAGNAATANANSNTSAGANSSATTAASNPATTQSAQTAATAAATPQQAANANAANQNQTAKGSAAKNNATTASVSNNALVSQSNTALTSGSAVVTLQSVDAKTSAPAGQPPAADTLVNPQTDGKPHAASEPKPVNAATQAANTPNQAGTGGPTPAVQTAAVNPAAAQTTVTATTGPLPSSSAETLLNVSAPQAAASTGTPAFTSLAPVGGVTQTANATGAGAAASGNASAAAATPSDQVAVEIRKGVAAGKDSITIKLNPAELGKIDVKMEISDDGTLRASIAVEKAETLDLLQKDTRGLERALQNAGLQADSGSLNFSLRGEGNNHANEFDTASNNGSGAQGEETAAQDPASDAEHTRRSSHDGALDISV